MRDSRKTRRQLVAELEALRGRLAELEDARAERMGAGGSLQSWEEHFRILFEFVPDAWCLIGADGRFVDGNRAVEELTGYRKQELVGKTFEESGLLSPDQLPAALRRHEQSARGERTGPQEYVFTRKDGTQVPVEVSTFPVEVGGRRLVLGSARDITERKQKESEVRASENKYRTLTENLPQKIFLKDTNSVYVSCNQNYARDLGIKPEQIVGRTDYEFFPNELAEKYRADDRRIMQSGQTVDIEEPYLQQGQERTVHTVKTPVRDERGNVVGVLGIFWDITEQRELEEQLRHSQKMEAIGRLAGGIAHDFNNLLTAILGYAELLKRHALPGSETYEAAQTIEKAAERAAELSRQLLGFARRGKHQNVPVDLHAEIQEVVALLSRTIEKSIRITQHLDAEHPFVMGDPAQIEQVILNLAVNARDAMPEGGELAFSTQLVDLDEQYCRTRAEAACGRYLLLAVTDTGCGIPQETLKHIFEPFFTTKGDRKAVGLGLATVYGIVRNHGGFVRVYSEVGQGSTFKVYLPVAAGVSPDQQKPGPAEGAFAGARILLVDDEQVVREVACGMLRRLGYQATAAASGKEAVEHYRQASRDIDLVIIDMVMPEMDGRACFRALKEINPDLKAVLSTGYGLNGKAQEIMDLGMMEFVQKPYRMDQLDAAVKAALSRSRA